MVGGVFLHMWHPLSCVTELYGGNVVRLCVHNFVYYIRNTVQ